MKQTLEKVFFWSGLTALTGLSTLSAAWSVFPMGGETLPHHVERLLPVAFTSSTLLVSVLCGALIAGTIGFTLLHPETAEEAEEGPGRDPSALELRNER